MTRRRTTAVARAGLLLVATGALLQGGPADAQTPAAGALGGFQGSAGASAVHVTYDPEGLLPIGAPVDLGVPDALATIASGPSTFARASAADPGDLLANPDALIQQAGQPPGTFPFAYPYRVSATNSIGEPTAENSPAPGLDARVAADDTGSSALASMPAFDGPAVLTTGSATATATTTSDGSTVTVHAVASVGAVDLLGILTIDSIVTDVTATSDGTTTTVSGGTEVSGATIAGTPVEIDETGIHGAGEALAEVLAALGLEVSVADPVQQGGGEGGQLVAAGLSIHLELSDRTFPVLGDVVDAIPSLPPLAPGAPSVDDVLAVAQANNLVDLDLAGASVSLAARPVVARTPTTTPATTPSAPPPAATDPVVSGGIPARPAPAAVLSPTAAPVATLPVATTSLPVDTSSDLARGIGVLAVVALLVQPFLGDRLAHLAGLLTSSAPTDHCPREGT